MIDYVGSNSNQELIGEPPRRKIRVVAPADLPESYELEISHSDSAPFTVTIPEGGVAKDEIFLVDLPPHYKNPTYQVMENIPTGRWKDGLFDLFKYGICHSHWVMAFACRELAMGQVMTRMRLDWLGNRMSSPANTFLIVLIMVACWFIFDFSMAMLVQYGSDNGYYDGDDDTLTAWIRSIVGLLFGVWSIYALYKTRRNVRQEFSIPEQNCIGFEDCMYATFCGCCTVAQIARHTGDYETNSSTPFTSTGLPDHVPFAAPVTV